MPVPRLPSTVFWTLTALGWASTLGATTTLNSFSVAPATAVAGGSLTVTFSITGSPSNDTPHFAVLMNQNPGFVANCSDSNNGSANVWLLDENADFGSLGPGVYPDYIGPWTGITGATGTTTAYTYVFAVPPDAPSPVYLHLVGGDSTVEDFNGNCYVQAVANSPAIPVMGALTCPHLNLEIFNPGQTSNEGMIAGKITNWGYWPVALNQLCLDWWMYDPVHAVPADWALQTDAPAQWIYNAAGTYFFGNLPNADLTASMVTVTASNCGNGREANLEIQVCITGTSGNLPGGGGYLVTLPGNNLADFYLTSWAAIDYTDDYSRITDAGSGVANRVNSPWVGLSYENSLVQETTANNGNVYTLDPNTGLAPCNVTPVNACAPSATSTGTPSPSPTITVTLTATPTGSPSSSPTPSASPTSSTTPSPSPSVTQTPVPTPTPRMALTKTVNVTQATLGDTLTFCLNWNNDGSAPQPMILWDTLSPSLTYVGASAPPTIQGTLLVWNLGTVGSNSFGQVCFWAKVNGYP